MVSRGAGRSAVAAAAYLSCSRMLNEYDGVQHDYTRKKSRLNWEVHTNFNFERFKFSFITWKFRFTDVCLSFIKKLKKINS